MNQYELKAFVGSYKCEYSTKRKPWAIILGQGFISKGTEALTDYLEFELPFPYEMIGTIKPGDTLVIKVAIDNRTN